MHYTLTTIILSSSPLDAIHTGFVSVVSCCYCFIVVFIFVSCNILFTTLMMIRLSLVLLLLH